MEVREEGETRAGEGADPEESPSTLARWGFGRARSPVQFRELEADWAAAYVYGAIATLVAVGGEDLAKENNALSAAGVIVVGVAAIWLAKAFSALVGDWIRRVPVNVVTVLEELRHSWPTLAAAIPAALVEGLAAAGAYSTTTGLLLAEYVSLGGLLVIGVWAALASERPLAARICFPLVLVGIGWLIVGLELAAKHL